MYILGTLSEPPKLLIPPIKYRDHLIFAKGPFLVIVRQHIRIFFGEDLFDTNAIPWWYPQNATILNAKTPAVPCK